jgi:hypothetical protein
MIEIKDKWWNKEWCPLFGALPSSNLQDDVSREYLELIKDARKILGTNRSVSQRMNPDPEKIEKETGYPSSLIDGARFLVHCCSAHDIISDAQFRQGIYSVGTGFAHGNDGSYLVFDAMNRPLFGRINECNKSCIEFRIDQLDIALLNDAIRNRAGLPDEFMCALTDNPNELTEEDWKHLIITPVMTFALMSIAVAWNAFKDISDGSTKPKSRAAVDDLLTAQKLLHAAERLRADESQQRIYQIKQKPFIDGRAGGLASKKAREDKAEKRHANWQKRFDEIREKHPTLSIKSIATIISDETGDNVDTIRRNIQK